MLSRFDRGVRRGGAVEITVAGRAVRAHIGESVATALLAGGEGGRVALRRGPDGRSWAAFCFMGVCQECALWINGEPALACMVPVAPGMTVEPGP